MTIVPLGMLAAFVVWVAGGPRASLAWLENFLTALAQWVQALVR